MTDPRAFLAADLGAATASVALIGRLEGRWRILGSLAAPAAAGTDALAARLVERTIAANPGLASSLGLDPSAPNRLTTVGVRSHPPRRMLVLAATDRALAPLVAAASRSGWLAEGASVETTDPLAMSRRVLDPGVAVVLVGAGDPPGADERGAIDELGALVSAAAARRPELGVVLAGGMAESLPRFPEASGRTGEILLAAAAGEGAAGSGLRELLTDVALGPDDPRRAMGVAAATLADVLDRRVEIVEIGFDGGFRALATPGASGEPASVQVAAVPAAALAPIEPDDAVVDRVLAWSSVPVDRHRLRDRLRELRTAPWADAAGDGALLRLAAARAAIGRLVAATPDFDAAPAPDLVLAAGGVWAVAPGPVVALAIVDVLRRAGASQYAFDHARLLGPLGSITDGPERRAVFADLVDDLLAPLGSVVSPAGMRAGRSVGKLVVHAGTGTSELDLVPGGLELVDLPPGETAVAEFRFRDPVRLGARGKHFAIDVAGGLGGLLVDLRDVPLRLPERHDRRRELLDAWQAALWSGRES
ncbi:MAG: hypothetical protein ACJ761_00540 [Chloroflexota bacterium]